MSRALLVPAAIATALVAAGCGATETSSGTNADAGISIFNTEPENPLVPGNTTEVGGSRVLDAMFTGLVEYRSEDAQPENAMAESIETTDSKVFTVKIKKDWKFHDGSAVTAKSFVDAWNWTAYGPNATQGASFFSQVQGYADVHPADPDGADGPQKAPAPATDKMSGLAVVDDHTFTVTLSEPFAVFPVTVGYEVFAPLPEAFFKDRAAFEANPVGNGPFRFVSRTVGTDIKLTRYDDYQGADKPKFKDLTLKVYQSRESAYADIVSGNLDFMEELPPNALAGRKYEGDLGDRVVKRETLNNQTIAFPFYTAPYDNASLRRAISMAINREEITERIYAGTRKPADGWVHPLIKGYQPGQCGDYCRFDPDKAKAEFAKSGYTGEIVLLSNTDSGHQEWAEAVANSIKSTLGVEARFVPTTSFGEFRQKVNAHEMTGMYRSGWIADYPSIENWLTPLFRTGASSNDGLYSNPAFDAKLAEADKAPSEEQAIELYLEAERMLAPDMPSIPLWTQTTIAGKSSRLKVANLHAFRKLDLASVEVAQ
ncbi:peptide ABC transporter substrate-binding protein [Saccharothrix algeriensis]|uniref:ABC transporter substrate-binding protein n=1 Tax=Saccharothrix algeriensis TaxID=173560 RepID=A0A8T8I423_9PSEU|nr:ABC transporter substrate-binding protein [Saccharothrix algeriensis]MBM7811518.1 oligopeptide transport system substrate-binding protein [Saccharothrix algeriensis]QTR05338.1 ABC transporter substrate-binding protein [Saccharothrix algeriensis]